MNELAERKRVALAQKIDALQKEFDAWRAITAAGTMLEKHHTQVIALTGHLDGLWLRTQALFAQAVADQTLLADARNVESLVLGLRRIWEFFRAKLVQRHDPDMRAFLEAADELAWACYRPVLDLHPGARRQPPMVFLNGGLSPFALSRDRAFAAENVPGESLAGATYNPILQRLPIAMIGVPWYQVAHLPDLSVIAHETGHAVESDFGWNPMLLAGFETAIGADCPRLAHWASWSHEVFADLWGCLLLGPAYVSTLLDFLAAAPAEIDLEAPNESGAYPPTHLRVALCFEAMTQLGFDADGASLRETWRSAYAAFDRAVAGAFAADLPRIVEATLRRPFVGSSIAMPLADVPGLAMNQKLWGRADAAAGEVAKDKPAEAATSIRVWTAAARRLYDRSPAGYATGAHGSRWMKASRQLIRPGTRSGESRIDAKARIALRDDSAREADAWFDVFKGWSGASH